MQGTPHMLGLPKWSELFGKTQLESLNLKMNEDYIYMKRV